MKRTLGRKDDGADGHGELKLRWDLLPWAATREVVKVLTIGAQKYAPQNWVHVENPRERYYAAMQRHMTAWWLGERLDQETGLSHLAHAICCACFLLAFDLDEYR